MGEIEERLKAIDSGKTVEKPIAKSEIEKALEQADAEDAKDILRARARRRKAEEEARAREAEQRLRQTGGITTMGETEEQKRERELKERADMMAHAKALYDTCIDGGGDPKYCAQMVAGVIPTSPGITAPQPTSVSDLVDALVKLDQLRGSDKGLGELKASFDSLAAEIRKGNTSQQPLDPITFAKQQAEAVAAWHKALQELTPPPVTSTGEPLEIVREKNRHEEKMEEVKAYREYKGDITKIASEIPERIGRGIAGHIGEGESSSGGGELNYMICKDEKGEGCGTKIYFSPEATEITCPKCGVVYQRKETKTE